MMKKNNNNNTKDLLELFRWKTVPFAWKILVKFCLIKMYLIKKQIKAVLDFFNDSSKLVQQSFELSGKKQAGYINQTCVPLTLLPYSIQVTGFKPTNFRF